MPLPVRGFGDHGATFVVLLIILLGLLALTIAGLAGARSSLKVTNNYQTGIQALLAAEAGALHAQKVVNDMGVVSFSSDVVSAWSTVFGTDAKTMPGYGSVTYSVAATSDALDPTGHAYLTATGQAPNESARSLQTRLAINGVFSPGSIYLPNSSVSTSFNGSAFLIDGNNKNIDGTPNPTGSVPGIGTSTTAAADAVKSTLSPQQASNVIGTGGTPSVAMSAGPSASRITNTIIPNMLTQPGVVTNPTLTGNDTFGTLSNPQITHFTGSVTINGNLSGVGILIVDQGLTISGSSTFTGLIIVRGTTQITAVTGHTTILGALWTTDLSLTVSGSASVTYSSQALTLASGIASGNLLPQRVKVVAWSEL